MTGTECLVCTTSPGRREVGKLSLGAHLREQGQKTWYSYGKVGEGRDSDSLPSFSSGGKRGFD